MASKIFHTRSLSEMCSTCAYLTATAFGTKNRDLTKEESVTVFELEINWSRDREKLFLKSSNHNPREDSSTLERFGEILHLFDLIIMSEKANSLPRHKLDLHVIMDTVDRFNYPSQLRISNEKKENPKFLRIFHSDMKLLENYFFLIYGHGRNASQHSARACSTRVVSASSTRSGASVSVARILATLEAG